MRLFGQQIDDVHIFGVDQTRLGEFGFDALKTLARLFQHFGAVAEGHGSRGAGLDAHGHHAVADTVDAHVALGQALGGGIIARNVVGAGVNDGLQAGAALPVNGIARCALRNTCLQRSYPRHIGRGGLLLDLTKNDLVHFLGIQLGPVLQQILHDQRRQIGIADVLEGLADFSDRSSHSMSDYHMSIAHK